MKKLEAMSSHQDHDPGTTAFGLAAATGPSDQLGRGPLDQDRIAGAARQGQSCLESLNTRRVLGQAAGRSRQAILQASRHLLCRRYLCAGSASPMDCTAFSRLGFTAWTGPWTALTVTISIGPVRSFFHGAFQGETLTLKAGLVPGRLESSAPALSLIIEAGDLSQQSQER